MNWHQRDHYHLESGCGLTATNGQRCNGAQCGDRTCCRYTVSRAWVNGAWIYDAWRRHGSPATHLHTGPKADCIRACEQHARQQQAAA